MDYKLTLPFIVAVACLLYAFWTQGQLREKIRDALGPGESELWAWIEKGVGVLCNGHQLSIAYNQQARCIPANEVVIEPFEYGRTNWRRYLIGKEALCISLSGKIAEEYGWPDSFELVYPTIGASRKRFLECFALARTLAKELPTVEDLVKEAANVDVHGLDNASASRAYVEHWDKHYNWQGDKRPSQMRKRYVEALKRLGDTRAIRSLEKYLSSQSALGFQKPKRKSAKI